MRVQTSSIVVREAFPFGARSACVEEPRELFACSFRLLISQSFLITAVFVC